MRAAPISNRNLLSASLLCTLVATFVFAKATQSPVEHPIAKAPKVQKSDADAAQQPTDNNEPEDEDLAPAAPRKLSNATGDVIVTDGKVTVVQVAPHNQTKSATASPSR